MCPWFYDATFYLLSQLGYDGHLYGMFWAPELSAVSICNLVVIRLFVFTFAYHIIGKSIR